MARTFAGGKATGIALFAFLAAMAGFFVAGGRNSGRMAAQRLKPRGYPQLMSVLPLPEAEGQMCEWTPASATSSLAVALQDRADRQGIPSEAARIAASKRPPARIIRDPYAAYSAVAVDPVRNEVVMTDENLFSILVYDRLENTPPKASMSEPKRMIQGRQTEIELQCSLYIDPANGDLYAVSNDTLDKVVVFSRQARGNVPPDRAIETPHTVFGIAVDERTQELSLTVQDDAAVVTYRKLANEHDSPIRTLQGEKTLLADPHGIAFDPKNDLMFVSNWGTVSAHRPPNSGPMVGGYGRGADKANWPVARDYAVPGTGKFLPASITVYPRTASGDTAPLRVIQGPKTRLNWPTALAFDPEHQELYVANDPSATVLVFKSDANGDVAPVRALHGPKTLIKNPTGISLDLKNDELWVANFGNHSATVYKRTASGDTPPLRVIRSGPIDAPAPLFGTPSGLAFDTKRGELLVSN